MRYGFIGVMLWWLCGVVGLAQEQGLAAQIEVTFDSIEIQRANTNTWLPLRLGAIAPLGAGDSLRTGEEGRAMVSLADSATFFLLPYSTYTLHDFAQTDAGLSVSATFNGVGVQQAVAGDFADYELRLFDTRIVAPSASFAMWTYNTGNDIITVADGEITVQYLNADERITVQAGQGFRARPDGYDVVDYDGLLNAAHIDGLLDGCEGVVNTDNGQDLLVRDGAGQGFFRRGLQPNRANITLLGRTESGQWTRIRFSNYYGWVLTLALRDTCTELIRYPNLAQEPQQPTVFNVTPRELAYLLPYYGRPINDAWFYFMRAN